MIESFKLPVITPEALTGSICSFNDEYGGLPLKSCTSLITGYQEGSGTPSPSNVRPLHAWSSANITACGVNLWDEEWEAGSYNETTGAKTTSVYTTIRNKNPIIIKGGLSYYLSIPSDIHILQYRRDGSYINAVSSPNSHIYSPSDEVGYINFRTITVYGTVYNNDISINYPSTDTSYHAYNGNTYTFTFGQSIYQGSIDWMMGVAVATWGYIASYNGETLTGEWLCNKAPYEVGTTPPTGSQVAYKLAEPIEIPLGGINLLTQEGQNNIFCDTGDTTLEWLKVN